MKRKTLMKQNGLSGSLYILYTKERNKNVKSYYLVDNDYNITEEWKKIVQKNPRNDNSWNAINPSNNSTDEAKSSKNNRNFRKSYSR